MGRHAGQAGDRRPLSPQVSGVRSGAALLTDPRGLASIFEVSAARRAPYDLPAIGTPEHTALLSGSMDLSEIEARQAQGPLVGFAPIVLDPAGPTEADVADAARERTALPSRRSRRGALPTPRPAAPEGRARRVRTLDDPTPTGELARPFVCDAGPGEWGALDDVPPPVSVDVFQKAVRAGVDPAQAAAVLAAGGDLDELTARVARRESARGGDVPATGSGAEARSGATQAGAAPRRTRREMRARERALNSMRGVTARRLAKGGVLAITALGVVSSASPQTLGALGLDRDGLPTAAGALDFAGALAPRVTFPELSPEAAAARQQLERERSLRQELVDAAADAAANASTLAGDAILDLAFAQDQQVEARRREQLARVTREAARNPRAFAAQLVADQGWSSAQFQCLDRLWQRESGWNYRASNPSSGAYGIAQALPGSKMSSVGSDWRTNPITQIKWGLNYIEQRYGTPCGAWAHSESVGWY